MKTPPPGHDGAPALDGLHEQATLWFLRNREETLDEGQRREFLQWMQRSPEHVRHYLRVMHLHRQVGAAFAAPHHAPASGAAAMRSPAPKVVPLFAPTAQLPAARPRRARRGGKVAAAVAAVALLMGVMLPALQPREQWLSAGQGQLLETVLADGTHVRLNADSTVRVRLGWLRRQVVLLQGEASFDVGTDRRPFEVRVGALQLRDIGTVFDVSRRLQNTRVGVVSGQVEVWRAGAGAQRLARLQAGRVVLVDHHSYAVQPVDMPASMLLDWQQRKVSFMDERLDEVAAAFNRHNREQVVVADAAAAAMRLSGSLEAHRLRALQAFLERDPRFAVQRSGDTLRVSSR